MTWLIIIVVLAAAFAPVAYMMPTKRDRALSELRMIARREGLEVDVTQLPKLDAEAHERVSASGKLREARVDCVSYGLRLSSRGVAPVRYRILHRVRSEFPLKPGMPWELDRQFPSATSPPPPVEYWQIIEACDGLLPADVLALAVTDSFVLCYWRERLRSVATENAAESATKEGQGDRKPEDLVADIREALNKIAQFHEKFYTPAATEPAPE